MISLTSRTCAANYCFIRLSWLRDATNSEGVSRWMIARKSQSRLAGSVSKERTVDEKKCEMLCCFMVQRP